MQCFFRELHKPISCDNTQRENVALGDPNGGVPGQGDFIEKLIQRGSQGHLCR